jgi:polysaccharide chain length determinant protein (PEP-CTERM system associated)
MRDKEELFNIYHYIYLAYKKRWFIIIPFCVAMATGMYFAITWSPIYEATTLIMVEPQRVPTNYVRSIVSDDIESRVSTMLQQITSRTSLEKIIDEFRLFARLDQKSMFSEDKLESLRKRISVQVSKVQRGNDVFSISFKDTDPEIAMKITNTLAAYFIGENLKARESQATGTNLFLEGELDSRRRQLEKIEVALKNYRKAHMGELPEQLQTNLSILGRLQEQLSEKQKTLRETKAMLSTMQQQTMEIPTFQFDESLLSADTDLALGDENSMKLEQLKNELSDLRLKYTDRHPDVVRLTKTIAQLEARIEKESENLKAEIPLESPEEDMAPQLPEIGFGDLQKIQQDEISRDIREQEAEIAELFRQIRLYQKRVEETPKREQELLSLRRDYSNIKSSYDSLVQRKLEAEVAVNMEKKQKGEQFRILDYAKLPEKPVFPDVIKIFMLSVVAGLGVGCGFVFLMDFLDTSLKKQEDIESDFGIKVLVTMPQIFQPEDKIKHRINLALTFLFVIVAGLLFAGFGIIALKGVEPTMEIVQKFAKL